MDFLIYYQLGLPFRTTHVRNLFLDHGNSDELISRRESTTPARINGCWNGTFSADPFMPSAAVPYPNIPTRYMPSPKQTSPAMVKIAITGSFAALWSRSYSFSANGLVSKGSCNDSWRKERIINAMLHTVPNDKKNPTKYFSHFANLELWRRCVGIHRMVTGSQLQKNFFINILVFPEFVRHFVR